MKGPRSGVGVGGRVSRMLGSRVGVWGPGLGLTGPEHWTCWHRASGETRSWHGQTTPSPSSDGTGAVPRSLPVPLASESAPCPQPF